MRAIDEPNDRLNGESRRDFSRRMSSHAVRDDEKREAVVGDEAVFVLVPDGTRVRDAIRPNHGSQPEQEG